MSRARPHCEYVESAVREGRKPTPLQRREQSNQPISKASPERCKTPNLAAQDQFSFVLCPSVTPFVNNGSRIQPLCLKCCRSRNNWQCTSGGRATVRSGQSCGLWRMIMFPPGIARGPGCWIRRSSIALGLGLLFTVVLSTLAAKRFLSPIIEGLLAPGAYVARAVYGGLHGGEPILLLLFTNLLFYASAILVLIIFLDRITKNRNDI